MKLFISIILLFLVLNSFSKTKINDTILNKLHGQGCGIIPNEQEVYYNIQLLENLQKTDSNNIFIYKHLAMQYYFSWTREKDSLTKESLRQKSIFSNIKALELHQLKKTDWVGTINNLLILYCFASDCENTKRYFSLLKRNDHKKLNTGVLVLLKKNCNLE